MIKIKFRLLMSLAATLLIILISGCGNSDKDPISSSDSKYDQLSVAGTIPWTDPEEDVSAGLIDSLKDRAVKIGMLVEAESDINPMYGAQLAMSEINRSGGVFGIPMNNPAENQKRVFGPVLIPDNPIIGGIMGSPIALVVKDNKDNPKLAESLTNELIQDGVVAIIGPNYSYSALKVAPIAQRHGIPLVTTTATNPDITKPGNYVFMASFDDSFQGKVMAQLAYESLRARTAATLIDREDPYAIGLSRYFEENFEGQGGKVVAKETYLEGDRDFTSQLTTIAAKAPDVIFMPGFSPEVPIALEQARNIPQENSTGISATFLGSDGWDDFYFLQQLSQDAGKSNALEGSYFSTPFIPDMVDESGRDFTKAYKLMFGETPDAAAAIGYDALKLVATAIRRAGSTDKESIRDQLAATRRYDGATYIEYYDQNRHPIKNAVIAQIKDGQFRSFKIVEP